MTTLTITRCGPLTTLQDRGRFGMLRHGISASGPMDNSGYLAAGALLGRAGEAAIELTQGMSIEIDGATRIAAAGGRFRLTHNGRDLGWNVAIAVDAGDRVDIMPGDAGNYGYLRTEREIDVPAVLGSRATNVTVGLGGYKGRALRAGDRLSLGAQGRATPAGPAPRSLAAEAIRVIWGIHADLFDGRVRRRFTETAFEVSTSLDRMGVRLLDPTGVFAGQRKLSLVSDAIMPGDIQILGDDVPIVLMRDHQPTGGYPRIATIVSSDLDRFAQMRPGTPVHFRPVTLEHAR